MKIRLGNEADKLSIINAYPNIKNVIGDGGYLIIAEIQQDIVGFLWGFKRKIPAPVEQEEIFINIIEVIYTNLRCRGLATKMLQEIEAIAKAEKVYQLRAFCDIDNIASHHLWLKNKFTISPVKMPNGKITGSFVSRIV